MSDESALVQLLENNLFAHITLHNNEIRFARDENGGQNIRMKRTPLAIVDDYVKNIHTDIFAYIMQERDKSFKDVATEVKQLLGITSEPTTWFRKRHSLFGGIYDNIRRQNDIPLQTYDESLLLQYHNTPSLRFLNDNISLRTQIAFGVRYDPVSNRIIIPIRNEFGELVGVKGRINSDPDENEVKYCYLVPVQATRVLYGYSHNYASLYRETVVITESEKSVMQAHTYGYGNVVALGNNQLSDAQARLIHQLAPRKIIIALDEGLEQSYTTYIADKLRAYTRMSESEIWMWDSNTDNTIPPKASPTDMGREKFEEILNYGLKPL